MVNNNLAEVFFENARLDIAHADYQLALESLNEAIRINPEFRQAYLLRIDLYELMDNLEEFEKQVRELIGRFPGTAEDLVIRGLLSGLSINDPSSPEDFYSEAIAVDPSCSLAYFYRGSGYFSQERFAEAVSDYSKCLELDPLNTSCITFQAEAYMELDEYMDDDDADLE